MNKPISRLVLIILILLPFFGFSQLRISVMNEYAFGADSFYFPGVPFKGSANFKVLGKFIAYGKVDSIWTSGGNLFYRRWGNTQTVGAVGSGGVSQQVYTSGTTITVSNQGGDIWLLLNPSITSSTLTITLDSAPIDGQKIEISAGGTLTSGVVITSLTISANSGQVLLQNTIPTQIRAGETVSYRYKLSNTTWYRIL